ncbi:MAG: Rieske (2Fe-2S) protein [Gemmatimonadaceae bacterium]|nr:Rieske (2Fe-2S) protein [Gemmatimonadaceae bacterium]
MTASRQASADDAARCAPCIARRTFLSQSTLAVLGAAPLGAALLGACGDGVTGATAGSTVVTGSVRIADYPALAAVGGVARVSGTVVAVVRSATSTYRAFSMSCPHQGTTVAINGAGFRCPNHGATFAATGAWTGGERTSSLRELTVVYNAQDETLTIG